LSMSPPTPTTTLFPYTTLFRSGDRGTEGKVLAAQFAREHKVPFLGICLGMQVAVIDVARNLVGLEGAHSTEFDPNTKYPVVDVLPITDLVTGEQGIMRLGAQYSVLTPKSLVVTCYGEERIFERDQK